ncbi:MAG: hypothetical protein ACI4T6_11460 [Candidatus Flemingiibacterium sp.]
MRRCMFDKPQTNGGAETNLDFGSGCSPLADFGSGDTPLAD